MTEVVTEVVLGGVGLLQPSSTSWVPWWSAAEPPVRLHVLVATAAIHCAKSEARLAFSDLAWTTGASGSLTISS